MRNPKPAQPGVLDKTYALGRQTKKSWRYRLKRRTYEIIRSINKYCPSKKNSILDIGAAEGLMLSAIKRMSPEAKCVGLEYSKELIERNRDEKINLVQGDAQDLPFQNDSFDIVTAAAVIEHLPQPAKMLAEARRVLKKDGVLIMTTPDPFFEKIAGMIGHLDKEKHLETFNLKKLKKCLEDAGFQILLAEKFMLSPMGFPLELKIEKLLKLFKLDFILLNQIIVGKK